MRKKWWFTLLNKSLKPYKLPSCQTNTRLLKMAILKVNIIRK